jgi:predicted RNase H-like HicB family nuclease
MRRLVFREGEDGYWVVACPGLPGCISQGETKEEAEANIHEAIGLYLEALEVQGLPVPEDDYADDE